MDSEKHIAVVRGNDVTDIVLRQGTTTADVRNHLNLPPDTTISGKDGLPFGDNEDLWPAVQDGVKLYCAPRANVA